MKVYLAEDFIIAQESICASVLPTFYSLKLFSVHLYGQTRCCNNTFTDFHFLLLLAINL